MKTDESALKPDDIKALLNESVRKTAAYVYAKSDFYRRRFDEAGLCPGDLTGAADLPKLPPTTKEDIAGHEEEFRCVPMEEVVDIVTTSGTSGAPVAFPMTEADIDRLGLNECLSFKCAGLSAKDTVIVAVTLDKCFIAGLAYFEGLRKIGATSVRVGSGSPALLLNMVERLKPNAIISVPSFLKRVASYAKEKVLSIASSSVRKLICIGEPVRKPDFALNSLGQHIADAWGASVYSTYAATELATSMCECDAGRGGHLHPELIHVEILDDSGNAVADGETGEVVATMFGAEAMPLMRFRTGDCAFMLRERCRCGLWTPRIGPIIGRKNQMMKIRGTTVFPAAVQNVLNAMDEVIDYVMIVTSSEALSDELEVIVAARDSGPSLHGRLCENLRGALRVTPSVRIASLEEVLRIQDVDNFRKKRIFVDRRVPRP